MFRNCAVALMTLMLMIGAAFASESTEDSEEAAVRQTINHYLHGLKFNDVESLKQAFYPDAKLFFVKKNGQMGQLTQAQWYDGFSKSAGKEEKGDLQIASIDIAGNIASVKVEEEYPTSHYTDYVSLLKLDGQWKIVNKVFYATSKHP